MPLLICTCVRTPNPDSFCLIIGLQTHPVPPRNIHRCMHLDTRYSSLVLYCCDNHHDKKQLSLGDGATGYRPSLKQRGKKQKQELNQRPHRNAACWLALLAFTSQAHLPRDGTPHRGLGPSTWISKSKCLLDKPMHQSDQGNSSKGFPLPGCVKLTTLLASLCQLGTR